MYFTLRTKRYREERAKEERERESPVGVESSERWTLSYGWK